MVRVAYVDRYARLHRRKDGFVVEHAETGVGKLAHLAVGHRVDTFPHFRYNAGIDGVDGIDIGEVLVHVGANRRRENRPRDVAAAARERGDAAICRMAEEAGVDDYAFEIGKRAGKAAIAVGIEHGISEIPLQHHAGVLGTCVAGLDTAGAECRGDQLGIVVFTGRLQEIHELAGVGTVGCEPVPKVLFDAGDDFFAKLQFGGYLRIACHDGGERTIRILACDGGLGKSDKKVRHLRVVLVALAWCRHDHYAPCRIRQDYIHHLGELRRVGERASAEFANLHLATFACTPCPHRAGGNFGIVYQKGEWNGRRRKIEPKSASNRKPSAAVFSQ